LQRKEDQYLVTFELLHHWWFLLPFFMNATWFWSCAITYFAFTFSFSYDPELHDVQTFFGKRIVLTHVIVWGLSFVATVVQMTSIRWTVSDYVTAQTLTGLVAYIYVCTTLTMTIWKWKTTVSKSRRAHLGLAIIKTLILYATPFVLCWTCYFLFVIYRWITTSAKFHHPVPFWLHSIAVDLPTLQGFLNAIVYGWTGEVGKLLNNKQIQGPNVSDAMLTGGNGNSETQFLVAKTRTSINHNT